MITDWKDVFTEDSPSRLQSGDNVTLQVNGELFEIEDVSWDTRDTSSNPERVAESFNIMREQIQTIECNIAVGDVVND